MKQQINLYQPAKPKARESFSARTSITIIALCALAVLVFAYINNSQVSHQESQLTTLQAERKALQQEFNALRDERSNPDVDEKLVAEVEQLTRQLESAKQRQQWLSDNQTASINVATVLQQALAAQTEQTRVTSVRLTSNNAAILIEGTTSTPETIGDFLKNMGNGSEYSISTETIQLNRQGALYQFIAELNIQSAPQRESQP